jgi:hypothetical protein
MYMGDEMKTSQTTSVYTFVGRQISIPLSKTNIYIFVERQKNYIFVER